MATTEELISKINSLDSNEAIPPYLFAEVDLLSEDALEVVVNDFSTRFLKVYLEDPDLTHRRSFLFEYLSLSYNNNKEPIDNSLCINLIEEAASFSNLTVGEELTLESAKTKLSI